MMWRKGLLGLAGITFLAGVLAYFSGVFHEQATAPSTRPLTIGGERLEVKASMVPITEPVPGTVSATDETVVGSRILASITRVHVRSGDRVVRGALLVEFDDSSQRSILAQREQAQASTRAALDAATLARDRALQLFDSGSLSRSDYDLAITGFRLAEAEFERARRAVAEAQAQLDYTRITAPMNGTVVDRYAEAGDTAVPGQALLRLFNPGRMRVEAVLRESLIGQINQGQEINAVIGALDATVPAVVEEIVPSADPGSRTFLIKALLASQADLYPGMFARLEIPLGSRSRIMVPEAALVRAGQLTFVYVEAASGLTRRSVRVGERLGDAVEVVSGLSAGAVVVIPGA